MPDRRAKRVAELVVRFVVSEFVGVAWHWPSIWRDVGRSVSTSRVPAAKYASSCSLGSLIGRRAVELIEARGLGGQGMDEVDNVRFYGVSCHGTTNRFGQPPEGGRRQQGFSA